MNGKHGGCGGLAGFAGGRGPGGGCWLGGGSGVGAIGAYGHGENSSPDAGGNRTRVREGGKNCIKIGKLYLYFSNSTNCPASKKRPHFWGLDNHENSYKLNISQNYKHDEQNQQYATKIKSHIRNSDK